jgi:hypothetical protein
VKRSDATGATAKARRRKRLTASVQERGERQGSSGRSDGMLSCLAFEGAELLVLDRSIAFGVFSVGSLRPHTHPTVLLSTEEGEGIESSLAVLLPAAGWCCCWPWPRRLFRDATLLFWQYSTYVFMVQYGHSSLQRRRLTIAHADNFRRCQAPSK